MFRKVAFDISSLASGAKIGKGWYTVNGGFDSKLTMLNILSYLSCI